VQQHGAGRPTQAVVLRARTAGTAIFLGIFTAFWIVCLAVSLSAEQAVGEKIVAVIIFGFFAVVCAVACVRLITRRNSLEVSHDTVVLRIRQNSYTLFRSAGESLRVLPRFSDHGLTRAPRLTILGSGGHLPLDGFSVDEVRRTCAAQGWRFDDDDPKRAAGDVQRWLHAGRSVEAAQLIRLFGPFDTVPLDDDPHTSLEAAVFEDYGDKLIRRSRPDAKAAFGQAARAQRAFAASAPSDGERTARLAEADRIDAKARD
jgi:hypothetical protein